MAVSLVNLKIIVNCLETEKTLSMKTNKMFLSCTSQTTTSRSRITGKWLKHVWGLRLNYAFNAVESGFEVLWQERF